MSGYLDFARFYDDLQSETDYDELTRYFDSLIKKYDGKRGITLDLACGTGKLTRRFSALGYDMIGVDLSEDMLIIANSKPHENIQYLCQDMTELDMFGTLDNVICCLDSINHLNDISEIIATFEKVSLFLNKGGLFIFDVNTIYKHEHILGNNTFVFDIGPLYTVWQNFYNGDGVVDIELDFFHEGSDKYTRYSESFSEKAYEINEISTALNNAGFCVLNLFDWLTTEKPGDKSEKIVFVAKKI